MRFEILHATLLQAERHVFRAAPGVREDQGRAVLVDEPAQEVVHPRVRDFHRHSGNVFDRTENREAEVFARVDLDDVHVPDLAVLVAGEELRLLLDRRDRRAQADADEVAARLLPQALEADRQEGTALRGADLVDLVEDGPVHTREGLAELRRAEDDCEALRGRDEYVWRRPGLLLTLLRRRIAGPHADADRGFRLAVLRREGRELAKRLLEVAVDVVRE